jgi:quinolinate synthase
MLRLQVPLPDDYTLATESDLVDRIAAAKATLGERLLILGHHYQRDEVIRWADAIGDSFKLARFAADNERATDIVFCGVHFMAESADVLTGAHQRVILPDLNAGCSMADMADIDQVEEAWDAIAAIAPIDRVVPITYMNSSAALKAFVGRNGGAVCTSSNARAVLEWSFAGGARVAGATEEERKPVATIGDGDKVLFFPDQHLGRNTGYDMGFDESHMRVWDPRHELGGLEERDVKEATFLLWKGHCSVHQRFKPAHVEAARAEHPGIEIVVHPECAHDVVEMADKVGSTERIQAWVEAAAPGTAMAVGTEIHMVQRLAAQHPDKHIVSLDPLVCPCSTMFRIDAPHLAWVLESLVRGEVVNQIVVDDDTARWARVALERMLSIT